MLIDIYKFVSFKFIKYFVIRKNFIFRILLNNNLIINDINEYIMNIYNIDYRFFFLIL